MGNIEEIKATAILNTKLKILHCVSDYPLNPQDALLGIYKF